MADINLQLDTSSLDRAMDLANSWSKSAPSYLVARAAQRIVSKAIKYTPRVPVGSMDTELDVVYAPGKTPTGKLSTANKNRIAVSGMGANTKRFDQPLAYLIQLARMAPGSKYNRTTNNRWLLPGGFGMLKGLDAAGRNTMLQELSQRMEKARHSSTGFMVSGWASAAKRIYNLLGSYIRGDTGAPPLDDGFSGKSVSPKPNMSDVKYSSGTADASINVGNLIGMIAGSKGSNAANYNKALLEHGTQPLQRAIDEVAVEMTEHYQKKEMAEMAHAFNAIR